MRIYLSLLLRIRPAVCLHVQTDFHGTEGMLLILLVYFKDLERLTRLLSIAHRPKFRKQLKIIDNPLWRCSRAHTLSAEGPKNSSCFGKLATKVHKLALQAPALTAKSIASSASGRTRSDIAFACALDAVPSITRFLMP